MIQPGGKAFIRSSCTVKKLSVNLISQQQQTTFKRDFSKNKFKIKNFEMTKNLSIESVLKLKSSDGLEASELGVLLESAIKFFLFQRTQIPVPFDSLHSHSCSDDLEQPLPVVLTKNDLMQVRSGCSSDSEPCSISFDRSSGECENAKARTNRIKQERKLRIFQQKMHLKIEKIRRQESTVRSVLEKGFKVLRQIVESPHIERNEIAGVVLILGPSVLISKETIVFEIDPNIGKIPSTESINCLNTFIEASKKLDGIIRHFYQTVICTSAFGEFTSNQLPSTYTHLNLLTRNALPDNLLNEHDLRLLEHSCLEQELTPRHFSSRRGSKTLHVSIRHPCNTKNHNNDNVADKANLFNIRSYHCYRLPVIFKGVRKIKV